MTQLSRLEIEREEETSTLFRAASLTTTLMDGYMRSVCGDFLHTALFPTIHRFGNILSKLFFCSYTNLISGSLKRNKAVS